jgi:hypothetical protein
MATAKVSPLSSRAQSARITARQIVRYAEITSLISVWSPKRTRYAQR